MKVFHPALLACLKTYSKGQFVKDIISGLIVAIIALPLSIALAIASGVGPAVGLYTAIVAGFAVALLGGSPVQITGPTAAFATIVAGIVAVKGIGGLAVATVLAGVILLFLGVLRLGGLIRYIPYTITTGFTSGIAVTILVGQLKDFFGLTFTHAPIETMEKLEEAFRCFGTCNLWAVVIGVLSLAILIFLPKLLPKIPASLIAVVVCALVVGLLGLPVNTIGTLYPDISSAPPKFALPAGLSMATVVEMLPDAVTIAVLAAVESLLSCVVADSMAGSRHNPNTELIAQGVGNIGSALFGGIPATGAIARTAANIKNGGRTPVAGMVHAVVLFAMLVILMPYAKLIPMPTIAAILFMVAYNMSEWREFRDLVKTAPKRDTLVLVATFVLTVVFDLVVAIAVGLGLSLLLFAIAAIRSKHAKMHVERMQDAPEGCTAYTITGPVFFGTADRFAAIFAESEGASLLLDLTGVVLFDATALHTLEAAIHNCKQTGRALTIVCPDGPARRALCKAGIPQQLGEAYFRSKHTAG